MFSSRFVSAAAPVAVTVAIAGCGSSSSSHHSAMAHHSMGSHHMTMAAHHMSMHAMTHAELVVRSSPYGPVLSDAHHRVLYLFARDQAGKSSCYGACASAWPPLLTNGAPRVGPGLSASLLGTFKRGDGSLQVTYAGHPLYYFSGDKGTAIRCQHVKLNGGYWFVVKASGSADMAKAKAMM